MLWKKVGSYRRFGIVNSRKYDSWSPKKKSGWKQEGKFEMYLTLESGIVQSKSTNLCDGTSSQPAYKLDTVETSQWARPGKGKGRSRPKLTWKFGSISGIDTTMTRIPQYLLQIWLVQGSTTAESPNKGLKWQNIHRRFIFQSNNQKNTVQGCGSAAMRLTPHTAPPCFHNKHRQTGCRSSERPKKEGN